MLNFKTKDLTINALIAAFYVVLVFVFSFMSYGQVQFRIAEVLLVLVIINPKYIIGLVLGTFITAFLPGSLGIYDIIFGTLASILGIIGLIFFRKKVLIGLLFPVFLNGFIVGAELTYIFETPYIINILSVSFGQFVVLYLLGYPFYRQLIKRSDLVEMLK